MMMFILIMYSTMSGTFTNVPGFLTLKDCLSAGNNALKAFDTQYIKAVCVGQPWKKK